MRSPFVLCNASHRQALLPAGATMPNRCTSEYERTLAERAPGYLIGVPAHRWTTASRPGRHLWWPSGIGPRRSASVWNARLLHRPVHTSAGPPDPHSLDDLWIAAVRTL